MPPPSATISTHPLTPDRWRDFAALMNSRFDTRHCWCMAPRRADSYKSHTAESNRRAIKRVVDTALAPPGILAYVDGEPAGWCAVAPREEFQNLDRTRATQRVDDQPAWSIACFFVPARMRRRGISRVLLNAAIDLAAQHGAQLVEAYPAVSGRADYHGIASVFAEAGFEETVRRTPRRSIMRYRIARSRRKRARTSAAVARVTGA